MSDDRAKIADAEEEVVADEQDEQSEVDESEPETGAGEEDAGDGDEADEQADEAAADDTESAEGEEAVGERRPRGRASEEIRRLRERAQRAERERDEARQQAQPRQQEQPRETPQQREERLALMDPDQRTRYLLNEQGQYFDQRYTQLERTVLATADRSAFDALCSRKPHFDAVRDEVETQFNDLLRQGRYVPRETLAKYVIGDRIDKRGGVARGQQKRRGAERIAGQRTRAPGGGSDVAAERRARGDTAEARERRLSKEEI